MQLLGLNVSQEERAQISAKVKAIWHQDNINYMGIRISADLSSLIQQNLAPYKKQLDNNWIGGLNYCYHRRVKLPL